MSKTKSFAGIAGLAVLVLLSCSSEIITVRKAPPRRQKAVPTYETSKVRPQAFSQTIKAPVDRVAVMLNYALLLMDIRAEKIDNTDPVTFRLAHTPLFSDNGEVGQFFPYKKRAEDALYWNFDQESLESGRQGNLTLYMKKGGFFEGVKKDGSSSPVNSVYFEGNITVKPAGRTRSTMTGKILYFASQFTPDPWDGDIKVYKSTGYLEEVISKQIPYVFKRTAQGNTPYKGVQDKLHGAAKISASN